MSILTTSQEYKVRVVVIPFYSKMTALFSQTYFGKGTILRQIKVEGNLTTTDKTTVSINNISKDYYGTVLIYPDVEVRSLIITPAYQNNRVGALSITYEGTQQLDSAYVGTDDQPITQAALCKEIPLVASAARTVAGQGSAFDVQGFKEAIIVLDVTAAGTALVVKITTYVNAINAWVDYATALTFTSVSAIARQTIEKAGNIGQQIRAEWTITSGSFTFSVTAIVKG